MDDQDIQKHIDFLSPQELKACFIEKRGGRNLDTAVKDGVIKVRR